MAPFFYLGSDMYNNVMISVDELWLKGRNRPLYFKSLIKHIDAVIKAYHGHRFSSKNDSQRLNYFSEVPFMMETIEAILNIPGISVVAPVKILERTESDENDLKALCEIVKEECKFFETESKTFRATVKRIDKSFFKESGEVERAIGATVLITYDGKAKAKLTKPDINIDVRIMPKRISISTRSYKGIGGLPWNTSGHGLTMLSGGFDSPVASFMMSKRGMKQSFVFFYAYPFVGAEVAEKIKSLTKTLSKFQKNGHLYIVPFGDVQNIISKSCYEEYRTIFFRKYMIEAANLICDRIGAEAIITGDSLGQVSSQTLTNMTMIDKSSRRIILRPLVGFNKLEVLNIAAKIGTHDISIIPHDDACALFAPENPVTNANENYWKEYSDANDLTNELNKAIDSAEVYSVNVKGELFKKEFFSFDS